MKCIYKEIRSSFLYLDYEENWDMNGGSKLSPSVYNVAMIFIFNLIELVGLNMICPEINLCPNDSIDVSFRDVDNNIRLLINIKKKSYSYYGILQLDKEEIEEKFKFKYTHVPDYKLVNWIKNNLSI